ncbi:(2Fe-2S)-binding protein [Alphaproteobacteria bacterium]|jgi:aerobic-type carbon monoxide dehydrogenase small subunit (CoxS/CutS family)|nr:(2Fe-2S)-binding protein [Alphaproteobacteria bacterium]
MPLYKSGSKLKIKFKLNNKDVSTETDTRTLLTDFLRHYVGETGTHVGCEHGICGACTILLNGEPIRSCLMFASQLNGQELVTIEGLSNDKNFENLKKAFKKNHALQCGFCTPGFLITITAFLNKNPKYADEHNIREVLSGNICRCTGYVGIVEAVKEVIEINKNTQKHV